MRGNASALSLLPWERLLATLGPSSMERVPFPLLGRHENHRAASALGRAARGGDPDPRGLSLQLE